MDCPGCHTGRLSIGRRRFLHQPHEPDLHRGDSRGELGPSRRLRRTRIVGTCCVGRPRRVYLGVAVSAARSRPLDHGTARARADHADRWPVRVDRTARDRAGLPDDHPRAVTGPVGHRLPLGGSHRGRQGPFRAYAARAIRDQSRWAGGVLLFLARGDLRRALDDGKIRRFAVRRRAPRQPRRAAPHERARSQRLAGALDHLRLLGLWGAVAGLLFVYYHKYIHPTTLSLTNSAEALLGVIAGGAGTIAGPIVGATIVLILKNYVSAYLERWNMLLGLVFVLIVIFMPDGVVPGVRRGWERWRKS